MTLDNLMTQLQLFKADDPSLNCDIYFVHSVDSLGGGRGVEYRIDSVELVTAKRPHEELNALKRLQVFEQLNFS